jgi:hypothetical protein
MVAAHPGYTGVDGALISVIAGIGRSRQTCCGLADAIQGAGVSVVAGISVQLDDGTRSRLSIAGSNGARVVVLGTHEGISPADA